MDLPRYALSIFIFGFGFGWISLYIAEQILYFIRKKKKFISLDTENKKSGPR